MNTNNFMSKIPLEKHTFLFLNINIANRFVFYSVPLTHDFEIENIKHPSLINLPSCSDG